MALPVITDVFRCTLDWVESDGATAATVFHVESVSGNEDDIAGAINAHWPAGMMHNTSARAHIESITVLPLDGVTGGATISFTGPNSTGTGSAECYIEGCSLLRFNTGLRGPSGRGRMFVPFVPEDAVSGGKLIGSNLTALDDAWDDFTAAMIADATSSVPVVASYSRGDAHVIATHSTRSVIGIQKRRLQRLV